MPTLKVYTGSFTRPPQLRVRKGEFTRTVASIPVLRVRRAVLTRTPAVTVLPILDSPSNEPGKLINQTAVLGPGLAGATFAWTQTGGPTVTLTNANTAQVSFRTPSVMPPNKTVITLSVVASLNGVDSVPQECTFEVLPQMRWCWNGTAWVGASRMG